MEQLATTLRRERELLEVLLFKLVEIRLLLRESETRYVVHAARELTRARHRTGESDLLRAALLARLSPRGPKGRPVSLRRLAATVDEPWAGILRDHFESMTEVVTEIEVVTDQATELARRGLDRVADERRSAGPRLASCGVHETTVDGRARLAAEDAYDTVLGTTRRLPMPALVEFLR